MDLIFQQIDTYSINKNYILKRLVIYKHAFSYLDLIGRVHKYILVFDFEGCIICKLLGFEIYRFLSHIYGTATVQRYMRVTVVGTEPQVLR